MVLIKQFCLQKPVIYSSMTANVVSSSQEQSSSLVGNQTTPTAIQILLNDQTNQRDIGVRSYREEKRNDETSLKDTMASVKSEELHQQEINDESNQLEYEQVKSETKGKINQASTSIVEDCSPQKRREKRQKRKKKKSLMEIFFV